MLHFKVFLINANTKVTQETARANVITTTVIEKTEASPLCQSIAKNDFKMVKKLIAMGADVNKFSGGGITFNVCGQV